MKNSDESDLSILQDDLGQKSSGKGAIKTFESNVSNLLSESKEKSVFDDEVPGEDPSGNQLLNF